PRPRRAPTRGVCPDRPASPTGRLSPPGERRAAPRAIATARTARDDVSSGPLIRTEPQTTGGGDHAQPLAADELPLISSVCRVLKPTGPRNPPGPGAARG